MITIYFIASVNPNVLNYLWSFQICYKVINNWFVSSCCPSKFMNFFVLKKCVHYFWIVVYPTQQSSSPSHGIPFSQTRKWWPSHNSTTVSSGMEEMPSLNMLVQRLKVAVLPLDIPCSGPVTHSGEILTTGKCHGKKSDRFSLNHDRC